MRKIDSLVRPTQIISFVSRLFLALSLASLMACSSLNKSGSQYHSAAFDDRNRAPASFAPSDVSDSSKIDPLYMQTQADTHFTLGETYALAGNSQRAVEEFRLTLIYDPNSATVRTRLAKEYLRLGMLSEAMEQAEIAVDVDPKGVDQRLLLGKLYTGLKMFDQAKEQYLKVTEEQPTNADAALFVGAIFAEQEKYDEAIEHLTSLTKIKDFEKLELVYFYIGRVWEQQNTPETIKKAQKAYEQSLAQDQEFEDALLALVRTYINTDRKAKATELLSTYQNKNGPSETVAEVLVDFYLEDEKYDLAFEQFEILEERNPQDISIKHKMALILMEKKQYKKAVGYLQKILAEEPQLDKIRFYLAAVYEEIKNYPEAIAHFMQVGPASEYFADSIVHASYLYKNLGKVEKAVDVIEQGISRRADVPEFFTLYASLLDEQKKFKTAVVMLEDATEKFPQNLQIKFYLGSMYDKIGKKKETIDTMKSVIELDANHVQALNYLAYTYAEEGKNLDEAEVLVRRALELTPNDGYIMDTLGWVLFKKGKLESAVSILEKAFNLKNTESIIAEHLGDAYYKYKLPGKARQMYLRAVEVETNNQTIRKLRQKITAIDQQVDVPDRMPASVPGE